MHSSFFLPQRLAVSKINCLYHFTQTHIGKKSDPCSIPLRERTDMKAIIPAAGQETRLYPQTNTKPKIMVQLAGKPILGHTLSSLADTRINDVVIIVGGPMQELITEYIEQSFGDIFSFSFVEQESAEAYDTASIRPRMLFMMNRCS
jgi:hypothetical protein